jgi:hypothetical protein
MEPDLRSYSTLLTNLNRLVQGCLDCPHTYPPSFPHACPHGYRQAYPHVKYLLIFNLRFLSAFFMLFYPQQNTPKWHQDEG